MAGGSDLDELFEDMFIEHTAEELEKLKARYATTGAVLEAPQLIAAKAKPMLWHYVSTVLPGGFKAQLAATSRLAAVRYREALLTARDDFVLSSTVCRRRWLTGPPTAASTSTVWTAASRCLCVPWRSAS